MEWKGVGNGIERETERVRKRERDGGWLRKVGGMVHNLDCRSSIYEGYREKDNQRVYQDGNMAYSKNL
jgi:hypothetical protein